MLFPGRALCQPREASNTPLASKLHTCRRLPSAVIGMDYVYFGPTPDGGPGSAGQVARAAQEVSNHSAIMLLADEVSDEVSIVESELGFVDKKAKLPPLPN
jgi:hypothetical protein